MRTPLCWALLAFVLAGCATGTSGTTGTRDIHVGKGMFGAIIVSEDARGLRTLATAGASL